MWNAPELRDVPPQRPSSWWKGQRIQLSGYNLGDLVDGAFALARMHWRTMLPIVLVLMAPFAFAQAFVTRDLPTFAEQLGRIREGTAARSPFGNYPTGYWITWIAQYLVVTPIVTAALLRLLLGAFLGQAWTASEAVRAAWGLTRPLVWAFALATVATFVLIPASLVTGRGGASNDLGDVAGPILALASVVLTFIFSVRLLFTGPAVVVEGRRGVAALRRSWRLSLGAFWKIVGNTFVLGLLAGTVIGLSSVIPLEVARANDGAWWLLAGLGTTIATGIVTPFLTAAYTMLYLHCRVTKEGLTLEQLERQMDESARGDWHALPPPPGA